MPCSVGRVRPSLCPREDMLRETWVTDQFCAPSCAPGGTDHNPFQLSFLPPLGPGGMWQAPRQQRRSCLPSPPPSYQSQSLGLSCWFAGISFACGSTKLLEFSGCPCSCPNTPMRFLERRSEDKGLVSWVIGRWLVLSPCASHSGCEGVAEGGGPHWGPLWSPPPLSGGGETQTEGQRGQPQ